MYTRIKVINGKSYLYEVQSYRNDGKIRHKSKYLRKATEDDLVRAKLKALIRKDNQKPLSKWIEDLRIDYAKKGGFPIEDLTIKNTPNLRASIKMIGWIKEHNIPVCDLRVKKSSKRGTLNLSMVYQLSRVSDKRQRFEIYKFIKMRKIRRADRLHDIVNDVLRFNRHREFISTSGINEMTMSDSER